MFSSLKEKLGSAVVIENIKTSDIRFPTSAEAHGSDAVHKDPDYSTAYVVITAKGVQHEGHGYTFTLGRGTEVVLKAIESLSPLVLGKSLLSIYTDFGTFWHGLVNESQLRWIGPEKGAVHLATAAIINALWDLWGKIENKPVWKVLCELSPEEITSLVDFTHITDELTREEAIEMLTRNAPTRAQRIKELEEKGFPAYITSIGWLGYSEDRIRDLCKQALASGFSRFKMKVGLDVEDDARRAGVIREEVGWDVPLMMDANQVFQPSKIVVCIHAYLPLCVCTHARLCLCMSLCVCLCARVPVCMYTHSLSMLKICSTTIFI